MNVFDLHFKKRIDYLNEIKIYCQLKKYNIVPDYIFYQDRLLLGCCITNYKTIKQIFDDTKSINSHFIKQIFGFLNTLYQMHFIHTNMSIDNLLFNKDTSHFIIINLYNSRFSSISLNENLYNMCKSIQCYINKLNADDTRVTDWLSINLKTILNKCIL